MPGGPSAINNNNEAVGITMVSSQAPLKSTCSDTAPTAELMSASSAPQAAFSYRLFVIAEDPEIFGMPYSTYGLD